MSANSSRDIIAGVLLANAAVIVPASIQAQDDARMLFRQPALSATEICFTFASDIWMVPRQGGGARRLTASAGSETGCKFSPDGKRVAYTSTANGNADIYVISASGGVPKRLTWSPSNDVVRGWTPDGKVVYMSDREGIAITAALGAPRLFLQDIDGVKPERIELPTVWDGSLSPDGKRLAYMPYPNANQIWKRYRGGRTTPIWIASLADASIEKIPRDNSTDLAPMWIADTVFFLSDRDGSTTLYSYDTKSKQVVRRINNTGLDIKNASTGPGAIVYEQFGAIRLHDLTSGADATVPIRLEGELTEAQPHWVSVGDKLQHSAISPTGVRAAFEARGEIITVPAKKGDARDITRTVGVTERFPSWSPDGQTLAYFSDAGGAYHLELRGQTGLAEPRTIKLGDDDTYYYLPVWSPDGKHIGYSNSRGELWYADVASGKTTRVDADPLGPQFGQGTPFAWSPDSRWITYGRSIKNRLNAVFVYDLQKAAATRVTDGLSDASNPVFDASGKYLYFVASTDAGPASDFSMTTYDHPMTRSLYAIVLRKDLPSPLAPESDEEKAKGDSAARSSAKAAAGDVKGAEAAKPGKDSTGKVTPPEPVHIDFDAIDQRTIPLPVPPRNYISVFAGKAGNVILTEDPLVPVDLQENGPAHFNLYKFDLTERKTDQLISDAGHFDVSRDGEKLLYKQKDNWAIAAIAQPVKAGDGGLNTGNIQVETV